MRELAELGFIGLVDQFADLGEEYAPVLEELLERGIPFLSFLESMIVVFQLVFFQILHKML